MITVSLASVREIYRGTSRIKAVEALRSIPVGISVLVRHPGGLHSCMNKPSLWKDVLTQY